MPAAKMIHRFLLPGVTACLCVCGVGAAAQAPVAHWTMDAIVNGVVPDASGRGHHARCGSRTAPEPAPGVIGGALRFRPEGEYFLQIERWEELTRPGGLTVMAWVRPEARNQQTEILCGKSDRAGAPPWPGWRLRFFWTRACFEYGTADGKEQRVLSPEWSVPAGFWSHVAATLDAARARVYVNAVEAASLPVEAPMLPPRVPLILGNFVGRKNAYAFNGCIDEVKVFDCALSAEEVFAAATRGMD
ncbi:MAG: LamG domain-containing protein [Armatimonadota bacterium]|nr:LamG domain-containing protein [Armatimonadota bacterium]